jgi:hypothetical protein
MTETTKTATSFLSESEASQRDSAASIELSGDEDDEKSGDESFDAADIACSHEGMDLSEGESDVPVGTHNCDADLSGEEETEMNASAWSPGANCGPYLRQHATGAGVQAQVLVANVFLNVSRLPADILKQVAAAFGANVSRYHYADVVTKRFLGVGLNFASRLVKRLTKNGWVPTSTEPRARGQNDNIRLTPEAREEHQLRAMRIRVREALAATIDGDDDTSYARRLKRIELLGIDIGSKNITRMFVPLVEACGRICVQALQAEEMQLPLPGLGIRSDVALTWDGVSLGKASFSRHETLCLIGGTYSLARQSSCRFGKNEAGQLTTRLLAAPSYGTDHSGLGTVALIREALWEHPARLTKQMLASTVSLAAGDGAVCEGGEDHRHTSTSACEIFMRQILGPDRGNGLMPHFIASDWGLFHRVDVAIKHALKGSAAAQEVMDVGLAMGALFGVGEGRVLYRSAIHELGETPLVVPDQGGTRKIVALMRTIRYLISQLRHLHAGLHARIVMRDNGTLKRSLAGLVTVGRRLTSVDFIFFATAVVDCFSQTIERIALQAQNNHAAAVHVWISAQKTLRALSDRESELRNVRRWVFVASLLVQYVDSASMRALWRALILSKNGQSVSARPSECLRDARQPCL